MSEPAALRFSCPGCAAVLEAESSASGALVLCPYCQTSMAVPAAGGPPALAPAFPPPPPIPPGPPGPAPTPGVRRKPAGSMYYVRRGKKQSGPYTSRQLRKLARLGKLAPTDLIWKKGFPHWRQAAKARGLFPDRPPLL